MRLVLEILTGPAAGQRFVLQPGQIVRIGRGKDADLVLADDTVSRSHCQVQCGEWVSRVRDLGSANGTLVNGRRISDEEIRDGEEIVVGETRLIVRIEKQAEPPPPRVDEARAAPPRAESAPPFSPAERAQDVPPQAARSDPAADVIRRPREAERPAVFAMPEPMGVETERRSRSAPSVRRPYTEGLTDPDPEVRRLALLAAAWSSEFWVVAHCRKLGQRPSPETFDAVMLLAVLGDSSHLQSILTLEKFTELGPRRFEALGSYGHPQVVPLLLKNLEATDPLDAAAAGRAFVKITGADIDSNVVAAVRGVDSDGTPPEEDRPEEVLLPDPALARAHWDANKARYQKGVRWCRGFEVSEGASDDMLDQLDLESRWEACLRGKFHGTWRGSLIDLERFPLRPQAAAPQGRPTKA